MTTMKTKILEHGSNEYKLYFCPFSEKKFSNEGHKTSHLENKILNPGLENPDKEKLKCPVCDQTFVSDKSLYGHMRNHSERNWRGMRSPPILGTKNNTSFLESNELLVRGWLKRGRRSRLGKPKKENLPPKKRKLLELSNVGNTSNSSSPKNGTILCKILTRKQQHHVCDICAKSFKSYQALGGHKAHHNNNKADKIVDSMFVYPKRPREQCKIVHKCPFCEKIFLKGQALGGHKRHCRVPSNQGTRGGQVDPDRHRVLFDFDLNEFPSDWIHSQEI